MIKIEIEIDSKNKELYEQLALEVADLVRNTATEIDDDLEMKIRSTFNPNK